MRKRVLLFCILVVVAMTMLKSFVERSADRRDDRRAWRKEQRVDERLPTPDPPPWVESTDTVPSLDPPAWDEPVTPEDLPELASEPEVDPIEILLAEEQAAAEESEPELEEIVTAEIPSVPATSGKTEKVSSVVINEIMFYPAPRRERERDPEPVSLEFIELYNPSDAPIALEGYQLASGVKFTFPAAILAQGGYLIVTPDKDAFRANYRTQAPIVGNWTGRLSNSSEEIRLEDAEGKTVDRVVYADQGDWARRINGDDGTPPPKRSMFSNRRSYSRNSVGWIWKCDADGGGSSLELITPRLSNNHGSNWFSSQDRGGTPGTVNSVRATNIPPLISKVNHRPAVPQPNQKVLVLAEIDDEEPDKVAAQVYWRVSGRRGNGEYEAAPMKALASGRYAAVLPAQPDKTIIEFYVRATDGNVTRTWPAAEEGDPKRPNALYQVDSETNRTAMAFYRLIMTSEENDRFGNSRRSNAQSNTTLILDDGSGPVIRYLCGARVRGANSRNNTPPPMRLTIPRDQPWNGAAKMNLNSVNSWLQYIGMKIFQSAGLPAPNTLPVQIRRNGQNTTSKRSKDYGAFVHVQPLARVFAEQHFPEDGGGNVYKKVRPDNSWSWHNGDVDDYQRDGWLKQTNSADNDWSDLDRFLGVMNNADRDADYLEQVEKVMDVDQWLRYLAVMALLANGEGGIATGVDDDYAMYRGVTDTRFKALPHDLDTILTIGDGGTSNPHHTLFDFVENNSRLNPLVPFFDRPDIRKRYFTVMAELIETSFSNDQFKRLLDTHLSGWAPRSTIQRLEDFMALRSAYATQVIRRAIGTPAKKPSPTSASSWQSPTSKVVINEVLAANTSAHPHQKTFPDVIELHNPGSSSVSMAGMSLTDNVEMPGKFIFPEGTEIEPSGYLLVYADDQTFEGEYHTGFSLKQEGETLILYGSAKTDGPRDRLDSVAFGAQIPDHSIGRGGKGNVIWALTKPTLGAANVSVPVGNVSGLRINEWLACLEARFSNDFIELANAGDKPVALGGVGVTGDYLKVPDAHRLAPLSFIGPQSYLLLESLGKRSVRRHACDLPFRLPSHHGWIRLVGANGTEIDKVHYVCQRPDIAQGRLPNSSDNMVYLTVPTPGAANGAAKEVSSLVRGLLLGLRISEIMYHPQNADLEFIELTNTGSETLSLTGVRFTAGIEFVFTDGTLEPGACVVLANNPEAFGAHYGKAVSVAGTYSGKLSNGGETLELSLPKPANMAIQRFKYNDKWYSETDGGGRSLTIIDLQADVKLWDDLINWRPCDAEGGSPGTL